eukprot:5282021-Amphidinium_carterae.2
MQMMMSLLREADELQKVLQGLEATPCRWYALFDAECHGKLRQSIQPHEEIVVIHTNGHLGVVFFLLLLCFQAGGELDAAALQECSAKGSTPLSRPILVRT